MAEVDYAQVALFEHRFWLQILGDHARFILFTLAPTEKREIERAMYFKDVFDKLLEVARQQLSAAALSDLNRQAQQFAEEIRLFKLELIRQHLVGKIIIGLPPTFINHMVNEVEEYLRILRLLQSQQSPVFHPLHYHQVWLLDAAGHAAAISGSVDMVEKMIMEKSQEFSLRFEQAYIKAVEMAGYMRSGVKEFPAFTRFNSEMEKELMRFSAFLVEVKEMVAEKKLLSTLKVLMPDHMAREECYYLTKLAMVGAAKKPDCDPTKPRPIE